MLIEVFTEKLRSKVFHSKTLHSVFETGKAESLSPYSC